MSEEHAFVHPIVATPSHAIAVNGNVLVHLWRAGAEAGAREVSELFERNRVHVGAALVVVEKDEARPDAVTRSELELLSTTLASRTGAVAVVLEGSFSHAAAPSAFACSTLSPQPVPIAAFTSVHTATDWLARCQPRLAGLSDLTGVLRALRRRRSEETHSTAPTPLRPPLTRGVGSEIAVLEIDEDHVKAKAFNMLFMAWRRTLATAYRRGIDHVHQMSRLFPEGIAVCQVVEVDAVPPDSETRSMFVEFLRLPHVKQFSVTHEGVGFKAASVRAIVSSVHALARPKCEHGVFAKLIDAARWHESLQRQIGHHESAGRIEYVMQSIRKMHRERYP